VIKDLIIIGGGPAGHSAALAAAGAGAARGGVLLVEERALGGTCTNRGCIPTKFFLSRSSLLVSGSTDGIAPAEWQRLLGHKDGLVNGLVRSLERSCADRGIAIARGRGRLVDADAVSVEAPDGTREVHRAKRIIIAAGSAPARLPGITADGASVITSDEALNLTALPSSMIVIGSGPVGSEFAMLFRRFGIAVQLVEGAERLFPLEDPEVDALFRKVYARLGVEVHTGDPVVEIQRRGNGTPVVILRSGRSLEAEKALVGAGRRLLSADIGCEAAGLHVGERGELIVDEELRTSQPHIRAAGDITGKMLLAHVASYQGEYAAHRAFDLPFPDVPYPSIGWATFTVPEIASVGLTEGAAEGKGLRCASVRVPLMESIKARIDRQTEGFVKIVAEKGTGRILGGTVVGSHASDLIHIVGLAIHGSMSTSELRGFVWVHPAVSEIFSDVIQKLDSVIHSD
jgi:dihydrolipoamide dehydrogenase